MKLNYAPEGVEFIIIISTVRCCPTASLFYNVYYLNKPFHIWFYLHITKYFVVAKMFFFLHFIFYSFQIGELKNL